MSKAGDVFYRVKYEGTAIGPSNAWAMWYGAPQQSQQELRDGSRAPAFDSYTELAYVAVAPALTAMNDVGDVVTATEIAGGSVGDNDKTVLWLRDKLRGAWFPLLRGGCIVEHRTLLLQEGGDPSDDYWNKTGGSDGKLQSFNDAGQLAIRLEFTDGTHGVFVVQFEWPGDSDADRDLDVVDFARLQQCFAKRVEGIEPNCGTFDFDGDGFVDLFDYERFVEGVTGPWNPGEGVIEMGR